MTTRSVHIVVVAYHAADELGRCLAALGTGPRVTVVDNSSSSAVYAAASQHGATYVDPGTNLGFGAGANLVLREIMGGQPQDVLLLNPDAILASTDIDVLVGYLHSPGDERVAAVAPRLRGMDGKEQRVAWPFPTPARAWGDAVGLGRRLPVGSAYLIGAVLLLRWEALVDVGLFDERFFLYAEEADWQRRALARGWSSAVCESVVAEHRGAGTSADPLRREALFHAAHETYIRKWYGRVGWSFYRMAAFLGATVRAIVLSGERRSEAARRASIYLRGPRRSAALIRK